MSIERKKKVASYLSPEEMDALNKLCLSQDRTVSALIRSLILNALRQAEQK